MADTLSYSNGPNSWKFGAVANLHPFRTYNADDFGGTYTYASLAAFEAQQPETFSVTTGNPLLVFPQNDYAWFAQYELKIGNASLFAGLRHEFQSGVSRYGDLAPRLAIAFAPGKKHLTVIRAGAGIFHDRRPPPLLEQTLRYNGAQTEEYILANPTYPVTGFTTLSSIVPPMIWRLDPALTFPRIYKASAKFERQLPAGFILTSDYTWQRAFICSGRATSMPLFPRQVFVPIRPRGTSIKSSLPHHPSATL